MIIPCVIKSQLPIIRFVDFEKTNFKNLNLFSDLESTCKTTTESHIKNKFLIFYIYEKWQYISKFRLRILPVTVLCILPPAALRILRSAVQRILPPASLRILWSAVQRILPPAVQCILPPAVQCILPLCELIQLHVHCFVACSNATAAAALTFSSLFLLL